MLLENTITIVNKYFQTNFVDMLYLIVGLSRVK